MPHMQNDRFTVIGTEHHMRAGDSVKKPVSILFEDDHLGGIAELKLSLVDAIALGKKLVEYGESL